MAENPWAAQRVFDTTDTGAPTVDGSLGGHLLIAYGQAQVDEGPFPDANQVGEHGDGPEATVQADIALVDQETDVEQSLGELPADHNAEPIRITEGLVNEVFGEVEPPWIPTRADLDAMRRDEPVVVKAATAKKTATRKKKPGSSK